MIQSSRFWQQLREKYFDQVGIVYEDDRFNQDFVGDCKNKRVSLRNSVKIFLKKILSKMIVVQRESFYYIE